MKPAFLLFVLISLPFQDVEHPTPVDSTKFNGPNYIVTQREIPIGKRVIKLLQVKARKADEAVNYCSTWFELWNGTHLEKQYAFEKIEPVGGDYGLFPRRSPHPGYVAITKSGDYDGRTLFVNTEGKAVDVLGGRYVLIAGRYAIVESSIAEEGNVRLFDFTRAEVSGKLTPNGEIFGWYRKGQRYFYTVYESDGEDKERAWVVSLHPFEQHPTANVSQLLRGATRLAYDSSYSDSDCQFRAKR